MKKFKIHFSLFNIMNETQAEISKLQAMLKGFIATVAGSALIQSNSKYALIAMIAGASIDTLLACVYLEKNENK